MFHRGLRGRLIEISSYFLEGRVVTKDVWEVGSGEGRSQAELEQSFP